MSEKKGQGSKYSKNSKKKKEPLSVMDYITIGFTAIIVILMGIIVLRNFKPDLFSKKDKKKSQGNNTATAIVSDVTPTPAPTAEPTFSDIGNNYANMANDARVSEIDGKKYFTAVEEGNISSIYVSDAEGTRKILTDNAFSINIIHDPFTFSDIPNAIGYMVVYIDADGFICRVVDGPYKNPDADENAEMTAERAVPEKYVIAEGKTEAITVVGSYVYYLLQDGTIGRISLTENVSTVFSKNSYSSFCVYYGEIYALNKDDGAIYLLKTTARTEEPEEGEEDEYEKKIVDCKAKAFSVCNDWIYVVTDDGIARYDLEQYRKDSLSSVSADAICALNGKVYYISDNKLYAATPKTLLTNAPVLIGETSGTVLNALNDGVYTYNRDAHRLMVSYLDYETGDYSELKDVLS